MIGMTEHQARVAARVLDEEAQAREHLVVSLSGAHAYGFPSPDSDLDLKAVHVAPTARLLGLSPPPPTAGRMEVVDGVEIDYGSNEIAQVLAGLLGGNGNFLERLLIPPVRAAPELSSLQPIARGALSRRYFRHYFGFATAQRKELEEAAVPTVKKLLYVLRTATTGAHLLETGEVETDLGLLGARYELPEATSLIVAKRAGERAALGAALDEVRPLMDRAFARLERARAGSPLPEEPSPSVRADLEAWLIDLRRARL